MELLQYWKIVRKRLWLILLLVAVAIAATLIINSQTPPVYRSTTRLLLRPGSASEWPGSISAAAQEMGTTYGEFMRSWSFAESMAREMGGEITPFDVLEFSSSRYVPSQFFDINATYRDPVTAQRLAATAAQVLISQNIARQQAQQEQVRAQEDPIQVAERERLKELQDSLTGELEYYADRIDSLKGEIARLESLPRSGESDQQILDLRRELLDNQSLRISALSSLANTQTALVGGSGSGNPDTAIVLDEARLPEAPLPSNLLVSLATAIVAAIGAGIGLAFLLEYLDFTIKTPQELDTIYGITTLGVTGIIAGKEGRNGKRGDQEDLVTLIAPRSPVSEAFRALRTNLQFSDPEHELRSLLITSAGPVEGKSLTAANLAISMAQAGKQVILVDCDLRKPKIHRLFGAAKAPGISNLIIDAGLPFDAYLQATAVEGLRVLTCGMLPPNPAELLSSARAAEVMKELEAHADLVIYDSPPAATVTDAVILATRVDGVLQVVKAGATRRDVVLQGKAVLENVGARVLGPILNQVNSDDLGYYSYYYYYGGYYHDSDDGDGDGDGKRPDARKHQDRSLRSRSWPWSRRSKTA